MTTSGSIGIFLIGCSIFSDSTFEDSIFETWLSSVTVSLEEAGAFLADVMLGQMATFIFMDFDGSTSFSYPEDIFDLSWRPDFSAFTLFGWITMDWGTEFWKERICWESETRSYRLFPFLASLNDLKAQNQSDKH